MVTQALTCQADRGHEFWDWKPSRRDSEPTDAVLIEAQPRVESGH